MKKLSAFLFILAFVVNCFGNTAEFEKILESYKKDKNFNGTVIIALSEKFYLASVVKN